MRVVGRDYVLKIADQEFYNSVFNIRKRYFMTGRPTEIGRGNTVFRDEEGRRSVHNSWEWESLRSEKIRAF